MSVLENLISQDFEVLGKDCSRWATTAEHDSLVIDREKGIFYWNSKNVVGDELVWLTRIKRHSFSEAKKILADYKSYSETFVYTIKSDKGEEDIIVFPKLVSIFWEEGLNNREYFYERLLTDDTINRFQLGYHDGFYTIPIFMDGTFRNFQCRKDKPRKLIRPWYRGIGGLLYNSEILKVVDRVLITEGPVDAILLNQLGFPAMATTNGSTWKHGWHDKFSRVKEIIVVCDNDIPGIKFGKQIANSLSIERVKIATFEGYPDKTDTISFFRDYDGDMEEFKNILSKARYTYEL